MRASKFDVDFSDIIDRCVRCVMSTRSSLSFCFCQSTLCCWSPHPSGLQLSLTRYPHACSRYLMALACCYKFYSALKVGRDKRFAEMKSSEANPSHEGHGTFEDEESHACEFGSCKLPNARKTRAFAHDTVAQWPVSSVKNGSLCGRVAKSP